MIEGGKRSGFVAESSEAVVVSCPRICSGEAYSGVIRRRFAAVASVVESLKPELKSLAMPKSSSFGSPVSVTRIFDGLMSR